MSTITITLNGQPKRIPPTTLTEFLETLQLSKSPSIAVAINDEVIPRCAHQTKTLADGDHIEVIHPVCGG